MKYYGTRNRYVLVNALLAAVLSTAVATSAQAAKLQLVSNWGATGVPSDVSMYIYVPDKVATNPPLVTVSHYCGGSAQAVFGQASGIASAADQFGFIMVVPSNANASGQNGRCWDVTSGKAQTRDGGGDPQAILQMVKYAISQYKVNTNRVYATGDSSGGMMTELLLALYPDVFKAGSAFAGVPAGCSNVFDGSGLCGRSAQTAAQWGDRVRAMYPGYSGHRPRVQLFHGDADTTITFKNEAEAVKEWTNVLSLSTAPTSTQSGLTLGTHQASRQSWKDTCGYVVLDFFTSIGGDHGPSDALFVAKYVLPFMGLDTQAAVNAAVDPEIEQCGNGSGSDGGTVNPVDGGRTGGSTADGGTPDAARTGGTISTGGVSSTGGDINAGGSLSTGGTVNSGGSGSSGGNIRTGGIQSSGGNQGSGGSSSTGGAPATGGQTSTGGNSSGAGTGGAASGGTVTTGGSPHSGGSVTTGSTGSGCSLGSVALGRPAGIRTALGIGLAMMGFGRWRRRSKGK